MGIFSNVKFPIISYTWFVGIPPKHCTYLHTNSLGTYLPILGDVWVGSIPYILINTYYCDVLGTG